MIKCNLAVLMAERGLKISDVSEQTKISRTTLTALSHNKGKGIQYETFDTLCEYFGITPGELFSHYVFNIEFLYVSEVEGTAGVRLFECVFKVGEKKFEVEVLCDLLNYKTDKFNPYEARLVIVMWEQLYKFLRVVPMHYVADFFVNYYYEHIVNEEENIAITPETALYTKKEDMWLKVNLDVDEQKEDS